MTAEIFQSCPREQLSGHRAFGCGRSFSNPGGSYEAAHLQQVALDHRHLCIPAVLADDASGQLANGGMHGYGQEADLDRTGSAARALDIGTLAGASSAAAPGRVTGSAVEVGARHSAPILTRSIYLHLAAVVAAVLVTAAVFGGLALKAAASRGELPVLQWGGER